MRYCVILIFTCAAYCMLSGLLGEKLAADLQPVGSAALGNGHHFMCCWRNLPLRCMPHAVRLGW